MKKINIILALLLLILSIGAVSAVEDGNLTEIHNNLAINDLSEDNIMSEDNFDDNILEKTMNSDEVLSLGTHTVNSNNYNQYFDKTGKLVSSDVNQGDTINLEGSFSNVKFIFDKKITLSGSNSNSLKGCTIILNSGASGSTVLNLNIKNTANEAYGVYLNGVNNCIISGCKINNTGAASYDIVLGYAKYNQIINNELYTYGETYGHNTRSTPPIVLTGSDYNYIANNNLECDDTNAIYLSSINGPESNFNTIYNNSIHYNIFPTSWSYGIQVMGSNNTIDSNTIIGGYRGISSSTEGVGGNIIINNHIIDLCGADYNHKDIPTGGEYGIVGTYNSIIKNNTIENARIIPSGAGISALDNSTVEDNYIQIVEFSGKGISAYGSNVMVRKNNIITVSGYGVFYQSYAPNLHVENNNITSQSGVGICIKKVNIKERPFDVVILKNIISTEASYIIDAADVEKDSNWIIEDNVGGLYLTPNGTYDGKRPSYKYEGNTYVVTSSNFDNYIDSNGFLKPIIKEGDIINFKGDFSNKEIKINSAIKITSTSNAVFYNSTFRIRASGVWIENLNIKNAYANRINAWGILVYNAEYGVVILNNNIEVSDPNAAYAIYIVESGMVDVINNTLSSSGNLLTYTLLSYSATDCRFINNTIKTNGTDQVYAVEGEHCLDGNEVCLDGDQFCLDGSHVVKEIYRTYGILMIYSSSNEVYGNNVTVTSKLNDTYNNIGKNASTNTIIGIDLYYNSHNNIFSKNNVYVYGLDNYMYGMGVLGYYTGHNAPKGEGASNNQFISNNINIEGNYFATGIIVGDESEDTLVKDNVIYLKSANVTYGVTLELSHKSSVKNNDITLNSNIIYGVEVEKSNVNVLSDNLFKLNAKKIYGIALSNANANEIYGNKLNANSTGENIGLELDVISGENCGIYLASQSTNNKIYDNNITSTKGYAINLDNESINNEISDNYLISEFGNANNAINNTGNNNIKGNYIYFINGKLSNVTIQYLEYGNLTFSTNENIDGAVVDFYDDIGEYIGSATVKDGNASIMHRFSEKTTPTKYDIFVIVSKEDYRITEFHSILESIPGNLNIVVTDISVKNGLKGRFAAKVTNSLGKPVSGQTVKFYLYGILGSAITDKNGIATAIFPVATQYSGIVTIKASVTDESYYLPNDGFGNLTILDVAPVNINVDTKLSFGGILATLSDNNNLPIENQKVSVKIGSNSFVLKTDGYGQISLPNVKVGNYGTLITFNTNSLYEVKIINTKISILAPLSGNSNSNVYYGSVVQYKVRVVGANGDFVGAGKIVSISINGKIYKVKTNSNGYAIQSIKLGVGKYTITAEYNGYKVSNKITFKSTLTAKNIVKKKAKKIKFSVKVVNKNGKVVKNKKITFKIKGKKYTAKTNKKGVATAVIKNLKVGKFTITSSYGGCTIKNTIKIKK